jgi:hypothetical protein
MRLERKITIIADVIFNEDNINRDSKRVFYSR